MEWITADGVKTIRNAVVDTCSVAEAFDRCCPRPRELVEPVSDSMPAPKDEGHKEPSEIPTKTENDNHDTSQEIAVENPVEIKMEVKAEPPSIPAAPAEASTETLTQGVDPMQNQSIAPHRGLFFYIHRPRTTTKKPVLAPLLQSATLNKILRNRTVLEFPTIYALPDGPEALLAEKESSPFILEEEYLRTAEPEEVRKSTRSDEDDAAGDEPLPESSVNLQDVDEKKVLEVLSQDLFEPVPDTDSVI